MTSQNFIQNHGRTSRRRLLPHTPENVESRSRQYNTFQGMRAKEISEAPLSPFPHRRVTQSARLEFPVCYPMFCLKGKEEDRNPLSVPCHSGSCLTGGWGAGLSSLTLSVSNNTNSNYVQVIRYRKAVPGASSHSAGSRQVFRLAGPSKRYETFLDCRLCIEVSK